jgi:hypothetical protein
MQPNKFLAVIFSFGFFTGCNGGGDESDSSALIENKSAVTSTKTFPLKTAYANLLQNQSSSAFTFTASKANYTFITNLSGQGMLNTSALKPATFLGVQAFYKLSTWTGLIKGENGIEIPLAASSSFFYDSNYNPLGEYIEGGFMKTNAYNIPQTVKVGDTGMLYSATRYRVYDSGKNDPIGKENMSYVIKPDSDNTALLTLIIETKDDYYDSIYESATFRITDTGAITRLEETFYDVENSSTYKMKYQ